MSQERRYKVINEAWWYAHCVTSNTLSYSLKFKADLYIVRFLLIKQGSPLIMCNAIFEIQSRSLR